MSSGKDSVKGKKGRHQAMGAREWNRRLVAFAAGQFTFGRGEMPPKNSEWYKVIGRIEKCPAHRGTLVFPFTRLQTSCTCNYHQPVSY